MTSSLLGATGRVSRLLGSRPGHNVGERVLVFEISLVLEGGDPLVIGSRSSGDLLVQVLHKFGLELVVLALELALLSEGHVSVSDEAGALHYMLDVGLFFGRSFNNTVDDSPALATILMS